MDGLSLFSLLARLQTDNRGGARIHNGVPKFTEYANPGVPKFTGCVDFYDTGHGSYPMATLTCLFC